MENEQPTQDKHLDTAKLLQRVWYIVGSAAAFVFVLGGCNKAWPDLIKSSNFNQRLTDVESKVSSLEVAVQRFDTNFATMAMKNDIYRQADQEAQGRLVSQLSGIQGAIEGIKSTVVSVQMDASGRLGNIEGRVAGLQQGVSNALNMGDSLADRTAVLEAEKAGRK